MLGRRFGASLLLVLFSLAGLLPPAGIVAHSHSGADRAHVHLWLLQGGWHSSGERGCESELPFAGDDTPVDWWERHPEPHRRTVPAFDRERHTLARHVHTYCPIHPSVLSLPVVPPAPEVAFDGTLPQPRARLEGVQVILRSRSPPQASSWA